MTAGAEAAPGGVVGGGPWSVPQDTGEALDLARRHLTVTIGFGPSLFDDRFGLADRRPEALRDLPAFLGDDLDPARCGRRHRASRPAPTTRRWPCTRCATSCGWASASSSVRWSQLGFGRTSSTVAQPGDAAQHVRLQGRHQQHQGRGPAGARRARLGRAGGRARRRPRGWPAAPTSSPGGSGCTSRSGTAPRCMEQEQIIGRDKGVGAPLGQADEFDDRRLRGKPAPTASPRSRRTAHVRLAHREPARAASGSCAAATTSPTAPTAQGTSTPGCSSSRSCRDAHQQFVPMQRALARPTRSTSTSSTPGRRVFACPPGVRPGGYWGEALFS